MIVWDKRHIDNNDSNHTTEMQRLKNVDIKRIVSLKPYFYTKKRTNIYMWSGWTNWRCFESAFSKLCMASNGVRLANTHLQYLPIYCS